MQAAVLLRVVRVGRVAVRAVAEGAIADTCERAHAHERREEKRARGERRRPACALYGFRGVGGGGVIALQRRLVWGRRLGQGFARHWPQGLLVLAEC